MSRKNRQVAFLFHEAGHLTADRIGGKAMGLVTMTGLGLPVPPGFAVSTGVCRAYLEQARYPRRLEWHIRRCLGILEKQTRKRFGDPSNPLLVSVRSGAPVSMPGMMDTILNLGLMPEALPALEQLGGRQFAEDTHHRFQSSFKKVVGSEASDPWEQLELAFEAICQSWLNDRAVEYRRVHQIPENLGTAMIVQAMTFGNLDYKSGTGVLFSRNVATGENEPYGEFLPQAQGEDIVGGGVTPLPLDLLRELHPKAFQELTEWAAILERKTGDVVEIEFTIESGQLWLLQYRKAKRTPAAAARFAVQFTWEKRINKAEAVARVSDGEAEKIRRSEFDPKAVEEAKRGVLVLETGLPASPGAAVGTAVFSLEQAVKLAKEGKKVVLVRPQTSPDDFAGMLAAVAIVTEEGGVTSHAAVVARELGKPAVVGVNGNLDLMDGDLVSVDGTNGAVYFGLLPFVQGSEHKEVSIFLNWLEQIRPRPKGRADFSAVEKKYSANVMLNDFYLVEAMAKAAVGTELEKEAKILRDRLHRETAEIFAAYLMLAVAGELRHGWEYSRWRSREFEQLEAKFGLASLSNDISRRFDVQLSVVAKLRESNHESQKEFLQLAIAGFETWPGYTGIGGKKWADIARAVYGYLNGDYGNTVFVDRAFDLRHNGNVLFNKHPMFSEKTNEGRYAAGIKWQLDMKREAGNIDTLFSKLAIIEVGTNPLKFLDSGLSLEVANLWKKGQGQYWWKESKLQQKPPTRW